MVRKQNFTNKDKPLRKVKTGCITCKRRKVKCDESWPVCSRCSTNGRTCDGYGVWGGGSQHQRDTQRPDRPVNGTAVRSPSSDSSTAVATPPKSLPLMDFRVGERETFEWFINRSAVKLPGTFQCNQWTVMLFQSSMTEPAVRHAMLALGSAHKEEVQGAGSRASECDDPQSVFTVTQYNRAIRHLQPCLGNHEIASTRVALLSCSLFVWMEFLRENYANGMLHLEYGLGLLREVNLNGALIGDQDPWSSYVHGWIITMFTRALVQAKLFGQVPKLLCGNFIDLNVGLDCLIFRSVHHARRSLEHIILQSMDLQLQRGHLSPSSSFHDSEFARMSEDRTKLQHDLELWHECYQRSIEAIKMLPSTKEDVLERFAFRLLRLYYRISIIMVDTCLDADESGYDRHEGEFLTVISNCIDTYTLVLPKIKERGMRSHFRHDPEQTSPNSTSDIGWIPPLYFTAIKCRNHRIRQQAINLLQLSPHKEGIWDAMLAVMVAKKVLQIEEGTFYDHMDDKEQIDKVLILPTKDELATEAVLPWAYRVGGVEVFLPEGRIGRPVVRCHRIGANGETKWIEAECDIGSRYAFDPKYSEFSHKDRHTIDVEATGKLEIKGLLKIL